MLNEKLQKVVLAVLGTLVFTTVSVGAAVGPARSVETATEISAAA